jgi:hypothetical protein
MVDVASDYYALRAHTAGLLWTRDRLCAYAPAYTTHTIQNRRTSVPPPGFELAIPAGERPQTFDICFILCSGLYRIAAVAHWSSEVIPENVSRGREFVNLALLLHRRLIHNELRNKIMPKVVSPGLERPWCEADHSATSCEEVRMHGVVPLLLPAILWPDA